MLIKQGVFSFIFLLVMITSYLPDSFKQEILSALWVHFGYVRTATVNITS